MVAIQYYVNIAKEWLLELYYSVDTFFYRFKDQSRRALDYAKFGRENYDYDFTYIFSTLEFKLKRVLLCLKSGYGVVKKEDLSALTESIKICSRLAKDTYDDPYHKLHDKKWGRSTFKFTPTEDGHSLMESKRSKVKTKAQKTQESKDFLDIYKKSVKDRHNDIDKLCSFLKNNSQTWWT